MKTRYVLVGFLSVTLLILASWVLTHIDFKNAHDPQQNADTSIDSSETSQLWIVEDSDGHADSAKFAERQIPISSFDAAISEISPVAYDSYSNNYSTFIELVLGNIGEVDVDSVLARDPRSINELLAKHSDITGHVSGLDIEITDIRDNRNNYTAIYRQIVHEVPFELTSNVQFDHAGKVKRLSSTLIDPTAVEVQPTVLEHEAVVHAKNRVSVELGVYVDDIDVMTQDSNVGPMSPPTLYLGVNADDELYPYWLMVLASKEQGLLRQVSVNAITGEAVLQNTVYQFKTRVCERGVNQPTFEPSCNSPDAEIVFTEDANGNRVCDPGAPAGACSLNRNEVPWTIADRVETTMEQRTNGACCDGVGGSDDQVDIVSDDTFGLSGGPAYSGTVDTIFLPEPHENGTGVTEGWKFAEDEEAISHEIGHAMNCGLNATLCDDVGSDITAAAISESSADMVAVIYCEKYGCDDNDWIISEESAADPNDPLIRDISQPQNFPSANDPEPGDSEVQEKKYEQSMIYSHVYYKLHTEQNVSMEDITRIVFDVTTNASRQGGLDNSQFDPEDFKDAIRQAASAISSTLRNKVDAVIQDMTPPPPPPTNLQVNWTFGYCHQCDCTEWELSHNATNASSYIVEDSWSSSGPWTVDSTSSTTMSYPHNGTNGRWFRVKAINSSGSITSAPVWKTGKWCDFCGGGGAEP